MCVCVCVCVCDYAEREREGVATIVMIFNPTLVEGKVPCRRFSVSLQCSMRDESLVQYCAHLEEKYTTNNNDKITNLLHTQRPTM